MIDGCDDSCCYDECYDDDDSCCDDGYGDA